MIEFRLRHAKTCFDVPEAFSIRELSECHAEKLIQTGKRDHFVIAVVTIYALVKLERWSELHDLRKNGSAGVHG